MKPLTKNLLSSSASDAGSRLLGFLVTAYLARVLGPPAFGIISIALSVLGYAVLFAGPGMNVMGTRHVASTRGAEAEFSSDVVSLRILLAAACAAAAGLVLLPVYWLSWQWLTIVIFAVAAIPMAGAPDWYLQGKGAMGWLAASRVGSYVIYFALVVLLVHGPLDSPWTAAAFTCANGAGALLAVVGFSRIAGTPLQPAWRPGRWKELLRTSIPLGISSLLTQTVVNLPVLIVAAFLTNRETGLFGAVMKLVFFVLMVDRIFYLLFLPAVSRAHAEGASRLSLVTVLGLKAVMLVAFPIAVLGIRFASPVVALVYGGSFADAGPVLACAMPYFLFTVVNTVMMSVLYASRREKEFLYLLLIGTAALICLCGALTVLLGTVGSAIGLSAGELVMTVLLVRRVGRTVALSLPRTVLPFAGAGLLMAGGMTALTGGSQVVSAAAGIGAFLLAVLLLGGITRNDMRIVREKLA